MVDAAHLSAINPRALAHEVCIRVWDAVEQLSASLGRPVRMNDVKEQSPLFEAVLFVAQYAQEGGELDDDELNLIIRSVYCPVDSSVGLRNVDDWDRKADPRTDLDVVIYAALARERLTTGTGPVPVSWLAALGGCSVKRLRNMGAEGQIAIENGEVAPKIARQWLKSRALPGFRERYSLSIAAGKLKRREDYVRQLAELDGALDHDGHVSKEWVDRRLAMRESS